MPSDLIYANEKYSRAVGILGSSEGSLQERLIAAYTNQGMHAHPPHGGVGPAISGDLQADIEALDLRLTSIEGADGSIATTIHAMDPEELREAASQMIHVSYLLSRELGAYQIALRN